MVNPTLFLNQFFLGNTGTILNLKICLESLKQGLFLLIKVTLKKRHFEVENSA
jgi:hypothetical protein